MPQTTNNNISLTTYNHFAMKNYLTIIAFPNPAEKGEVRIRINSPENLSSSIRIYNLAGELIKGYNEGVVLDGCEHAIRWYGKNDSGATVGSGVYLVNMQVGGTSVKTVKVAVVK